MSVVKYKDMSVEQIEKTVEKNLTETSNRAALALKRSIKVLESIRDSAESTVVTKEGAVTSPDYGVRVKAVEQLRAIAGSRRAKDTPGKGVRTAIQAEKVVFESGLVEAPKRESST